MTMGYSWVDRDPVVALVEQLEAEFLFRSVDPVKELLGITTHRIEDGVVVSMRKDLNGWGNRALGFTSVTESLVERLLGIYTEEVVSDATLQFAPDLLPMNWRSIAARYGLVIGAEDLKLIARIDRTQVEVPETTLRVAEVAPAVEHADFRSFAAWENDEMIALGNLFVLGDDGLLTTTTSLQGRRRRRAESAVAAAVMAAARSMGCRLLVAGTAAPGPDRMAPSLNNLLRLGFEPAYVRSDWNWCALAQ
ncbi:hypothetical protein GCM10029976_033280 [Kribbella albertanoniae]|uniref:N-acetyltransferase domain-containing protein n=1 Tax=Kribbella albertanoniae TaxID=1266829 RepID=A0A4R4QJR8_9ACTN|nr:hypothetical protein [Kribbella albertanoniae]TDC35462.1 hypothetical protein E1261_00940 [Kribbella albertanoniae]